MNNKILMTIGIIVVVYGIFWAVQKNIKKQKGEDPELIAEAKSLLAKIDEVA